MLSGLSSVATKTFPQFLVDSSLLKAGFQQVLAGKSYDEIDRYILSRHLLPAERLTQAYADYYRLPFIRLVDRPIPPAAIHLLPLEICRQYTVVVYEVKGLDVFLAVGKPAFLQKNAPSVLTKLRQQKGIRIHLAVAPTNDVLAVLRKDVEQHASKTAPAVSAPTVSSGPIALKPEEIAQAPVTQNEAPSVALSPVNPVPAPKDLEQPIQSLNKKDLINEVEPRQKKIDLRQLDIPRATLYRIPYPVAKKYKLIVFGEEPGRSSFEPAMVKAAILNPDDIHVQEMVSYIEQRNKVLVDRYLTDQSSFDAALALYDEAKADTEPNSAKAETGTEVVEKDIDLTKLPGETKQPDEKPVSPTDGHQSFSVPPKTGSAPAPKPATNNQVAATNKFVMPAGDGQGGLSLSAEDIIYHPTAEQSAEDLQRLAKEQQTSLDDQNLDRLLKGPVTSIEDLAKIFRSGIIPEIVAGTLFLAIRMQASDVHIEAQQESVRLRFRIDGILHDVMSVPAFLHAPLISRIKILSKMKIDEQRIPQDGRFDVIIDNRQVDLRVSTLPTVHGEKIVMRLLDKSEGVLTLEQLGVTGSNFDVLVENINRPYGIILSTGPTGSGKSTTLYAILSRISKPGVNIITLEDPVEYELPGLNQAQVKPQIGFTFAEGLRSVLRQDPNVIMVGEIRDLETAAMTTHAALTGHLVLSTLHTNDAAGALPRLINMGVEPFLITSSINAVIGQRLVRKICDNCREKTPVPPAILSFTRKVLAEMPSGLLKNVNTEELVFYHGRGCDQCNNGYRGRLGIFEVLAMTDVIEDLAIRKAPSSEIKKAAIKGGMITMVQDGLIKALKGITTIDEVVRVTTFGVKEVPGE